jgi:hypothetical protein
MSHLMLVILTSAVVFIAAPVAIYAAVKRRMLLMTLALAVSQVALGIQQLGRSEWSWLPYFSFSVAVPLLVSSGITLFRARRA